VPETLISTEPKILQFLETVRSDNSRRAYGHDLAEFAAWCDEWNYSPLPCSREAVLAWVGFKIRSNPHISAAYIKRHLSALASLHCTAKAPSPFDLRLSRDVDAFLKEHSVEKKLSAPELCDPEYNDFIRTCQGSLIANIRDLAVFSWMRHANLGRAEIARLELKDLERTSRSYLIDVPASRKRPAAAREILPEQSSRCPVRAMDRWIDRLRWQGVTSGKVFRAVNRGGRIASASFAPAACLVAFVKHRFAAGLDLPYTTDSLRYGWMVDLADRGVEMMQIATMLGTSIFTVGRALKNRKKD